MTETRDQFLTEFKRFLSTHLDSHHSAETTLELEVAALITMVDLGKQSAHRQLWLEMLDVILEYATRSLNGEDGARLRAMYRLADAHIERTAKL